MPTVKHVGGRVMICACFAAMGPWYLSVTELIVNFSVYQNILSQNYSLVQINFMEQDNNLKHGSKSTTSQESSLTQSPDLNPTEKYYDKTLRELCIKKCLQTLTK